MRYHKGNACWYIAGHLQYIGIKYLMRFSTGQETKEANRMGTWGPKLYQDDLAEDIRDYYKEQLHRGKKGIEITKELLIQYQMEINDLKKLLCFGLLWQIRSGIWEDWKTKLKKQPSNTFYRGMIWNVGKLKTQRWPKRENKP